MFQTEVFMSTDTAKKEKERLVRLPVELEINDDIAKNRYELSRGPLA